MSYALIANQLGGSQVVITNDFTGELVRHLGVLPSGLQGSMTVQRSHRLAVPPTHLAPPPPHPRRPPSPSS